MTPETVKETPEGGLHIRELFDVGLSDAERELLALLLEECGEVQQIIGKILRHGYESSDPTNPGSPTNRQLLEMEIGDMECAQLMLERSGAINWMRVKEREREKREKVKRYLHFQSNAESIRAGVDSETN